MSEAQANYLAAKATVQEINSQHAKRERKFIKDKGIVNHGGIVPRRIYCIEDEGEFEKANEEYCDAFSADGCDKELLAAEAALKKAEDGLIATGIKFAPLSIRKLLREEAKKDAAIRSNFLEIAIKIDPVTMTEVV